MRIDAEERYDMIVIFFESKITNVEGRSTIYQNVSSILELK